MVLEGGAMRGMFTAGVLDVMMEQKLRVDGLMGVSAGAVFGCNYKSGQIGRTVRYNTRYCRNWRYASFRSLLLTGDLFGEKFCYHDIPETLDPFDKEAFRANPAAFWCVCTDVETGEAVYHRCEDGGAKDLKWFQASASMPLASRIVRVDGRQLLDGGVADSIPLKAMEGLGYQRNVVILTQPDGCDKRTEIMEQIEYGCICDRTNRVQLDELVEIMLEVALNRSPTMKIGRDAEYPTAYVQQQEKAGACLVIRPPHRLEVKQVEKDPDKLRAAYQLGREEAEKRLEEIRAFIGEEKV